MSRPCWFGSAKSGFGADMLFILAAMQETASRDECLIKKLHDTRVSLKAGGSMNAVSLRSRRQHKAWGVSPRNRTTNSVQPAKRATAQREQNARLLHKPSLSHRLFHKGSSPTYYAWLSGVAL